MFEDGNLQDVGNLCRWQVQRRSLDAPEERLH